MKKLGRLIVIDFEATCWSDEEKVSREESEIIEIGFTEVSMQNQFNLDPRILKTDSIFCFPTRKIQVEDVGGPVTLTAPLSQYCTDLTGITQEKLTANAISFPQACLKMRNAYEKWTWVSWGEYDRDILTRNCRNRGVDYPLSRNHINLKLAFALITGYPICGILEALDYLQMDPFGKHHSGADDSRNEARILVKLAAISRNLFAGMQAALASDNDIVL